MSRKKEIETALAPFQPGCAVRLTEGATHLGFRNLRGHVVRTVKSRRLVRVLCENGELYEAFPENVELLTEADVCGCSTAGNTN